MNRPNLELPRPSHPCSGRATPADCAPPRVVTSADPLRAAVLGARQSAKTIGLVPTMGALHAGHLSLVERSCRECDCTVVSIFVNPTQFGPKEDFARYPRDLEADLRALSAYAVDLVFVPTVEHMYPAGSRTAVEVGAVAEKWEGACRPGHFRGVATVVLKLLNLVQPDVAYFGQKDYQQTVVVRRVVADLDVPVEIRVCPTVREADGLALSSRNVYLSPEERQRALSLSRGLRRAEELVRGGERDAAVVRQVVADVLAGQSSRHTPCAVTVDGTESEPATVRDQAEVRVDYVAVVDPQTLEEVREIRGPTVVAVAARVGGTRLIDNTILNPPASGGRQPPD